MERQKLLPLHLLLIALPMIASILGGLLTTGSFATFTTLTGAQGISPAQFHLAISIFVGVFAFIWRFFPKTYVIVEIFVLSLIYTIMMSTALQLKSNLLFLFGLNIVYAFLLAAVTKLTFYSKFLLRFRLFAFTIIAALLHASYFFVLYKLLTDSYTSSSFVENYLGAFYLFVFTGFGLSLADNIITRKDIEVLRKIQQRQAEEEDETEDDI
ncbi:MAG: hypothetical protein PHY48_11180 [Candidatus Cloacimonetes bacterium]|nr:hypothetical protein [Candidatus Cloacimonadota bacterium]